MNTTILAVGIIIIVAFVTALAAPFFIDWSSQRKVFETELQRTIGAPVSIAGDIDVSLLPEIRITFNDVSIGEADGDGNKPLTIDRVYAVVSIAAIFEGKLDVISAKLARPSLDLQMTAQGRFAALEGIQQAALQRLSAESLEIEDGVIVARDADGNEKGRLSDIRGTSTIRSFSGPYRYTGEFAIDGSLYDVTLATGRFRDQRSRLTISAEPLDQSFKLTSEGDLSLFDGDELYAGRFELVPVMGGEAAVEGSIEEARTALDDVDPEGTYPGFDEEDVLVQTLPWRLAGPIRVSSERIDARGTDLSLGDDDRNVRMVLDALVPLRRSEPLTVRFDARQMDWDRLFGAETGGAVPFPKALSEFASVFSLTTAQIMPSRSVNASFSADTIISGGDIVRGIFAEVSSDDDALIVDELRLGLPGQTDIALEGEIVSWEGREFNGQLSLASQQLHKTMQWLLAIEESATPSFTQAGPMTLTSKVGVAGPAFSMKEARGTFDDAAFTTNVTFLQPTDTGEGSLILQVDAEKFDLSPFVPIAQRATTALINRIEGGQSDAQAIGRNPLRVTANVEIGEALLGQRRLEEAKLDLRYTVDELQISELAIGGFEGARFQGSGSVSQITSVPSGKVSLRLSTSEIGPLLVLFQDRLSQDELALWQKRLGGLSPADLGMELTFGRGTSGEWSPSMRLRPELRLDVNGTANETQISAVAGYQGAINDLSAGRYVLDVGIQNASSAELLAQLGLPGESTEAGLPGAVELSLSRESDTPVEVGVDATLFGGTVGADGRLLSLTDLGGLALSVDADFADVSAAAGFIGIDVPQTREHPFHMTASLEEARNAVSVTKLDGTLNEDAFAGRLTVQPGALGTKVKGRLDFERLSLPWLASTAIDLHSPQNVSTDVWRWDASNLSALELDVKARSLATGLNANLDDSFLRLKSEEGVVRITDFTSAIAAGDMSGSVTFRTSDDTLLSDAQLTFDNVALSEVFSSGASEGTNPLLAQGTLSSSINFSATGTTRSEILSSATGEGTLSIHNAVAPHMTPEAFSLILERVEGEDELQSEAVSAAFASFLEQGDLQIASLTQSFSVSEGVVRLSRTRNEGDGAQIVVSGQYTPNTDALDVLLQLTSKAPEIIEKDIPPVDIAFLGPLADPERQVDAFALANVLNVQRFEREIERVERLQVEIAERERLQLELSSLRSERAFEERQRREAERRALEERNAEDTPTPDLTPTPEPEATPSPAALPGRASGAAPSVPPVSSPPQIFAPISLPESRAPLVPATPGGPAIIRPSPGTGQASAPNITIITPEVPTPGNVEPGPQPPNLQSPSNEAPSLEPPITVRTLGVQEPVDLIPQSQLPQPIIVEPRRVSPAQRRRVPSWRDPDNPDNIFNSND